MYVDTDMKVSGAQGVLISEAMDVGENYVKVSDVIAVSPMIHRC